MSPHLAAILREGTSPGVQSAAKGIFGVSAKELNLPQAAFIAGLPQSPFRYTPFTNQGTLKENLEPGLNRMKTVLKRMLDTGKITEEQYKEALAYDITKDFIPPGKTTVQQYPFLTMEIEKRAIEAMTRVLAEKDGYTLEDLKNNEELYKEYKYLAEKDLRQNGYEIHTTIDKAIYDAMQRAKDQFTLYGDPIDHEEIDPDTGEKRIVKKPVEVGAVLIENKTGRIISFVGGRNFHISQTNHAFSAKRSNGSTMKPLLVYAPAMEMGVLQPGSVLPDIPLNGSDKRRAVAANLRTHLQRACLRPACDNKILQHSCRESLCRYFGQTSGGIPRQNGLHFFA